jgi:hypothetical protein
MSKVLGLSYLERSEGLRAVQKAFQCAAMHFSSLPSLPTVSRPLGTTHGKPVVLHFSGRSLRGIEGSRIRSAEARVNHFIHAHSFAAIDHLKLCGTMSSMACTGKGIERLTRRESATFDSHSRMRQ